MNNVMEQWLFETPQTRLSEEEEIEIFSKIRRRDSILKQIVAENRHPNASERILISEGEASFETLIRNLSHLARSYAGKYASRYSRISLDRDDLEQEAMLGVIRAAELFRPGSGCRFSTYAVFWIEQSIRRAIEDKGDLIRKPASVHRHFRMISRYPDSTDASVVASGTGISEEEVCFLRKLKRRSVASLDGDADADDGRESLYEQIAEPGDFREKVEEDSLKEDLRATIRSIGDRKQRMVMELHLGYTDSSACFTDRQISQMLGMGTQDVRKIIRRTETELKRCGFGRNRVISI